VSWAFGGAGWTRTIDRRIMSLIRPTSGTRENQPRVALTSNLDYSTMPDVSQPFAVRRGTHAGHISRSLAARLLGAAAMDSHNGTTLIDPRIRNRAAWASGVPAATDAFR
jgi:hypothetical protein